MFSWSVLIILTDFVLQLVRFCHFYGTMNASISIQFKMVISSRFILSYRYCSCQVSIMERIGQLWRLDWKVSECFLVSWQLPFLMIINEINKQEPHNQMCAIHNVIFNTTLISICYVGVYTAWKWCTIKTAHAMDHWNSMYAF